MLHYANLFEQLNLWCSEDSETSYMKGNILTSLKRITLVNYKIFLVNYYNTSKLNIPIVCPSWVGAVKTVNNFWTEVATLLGLYHSKARAEAVQKIPFKNFWVGEKVQFQNSIEKSMGINKTTRFPRYTRRDLVTRSNRANHVRSTSETIVNKKQS